MSKCYINKNFFEFVIAKHIPFESLEEDFANFAGEDSFNSEVAEAALELAFELYPDDQPGKDNDDLMDLRHEFVSEFLEHARCEVIKKWASNLGMFTKEQAQSNVDTQREVSKEYWTKKHDKELNLARERCYNDGIDDGTRMTIKKFSKMSSYAFSKWKLEHQALEQKINASKILADKADDHVVQDSEDEAWEQMMAIRERKFDV